MQRKRNLSKVILLVTGSFLIIVLISLLSISVSYKKIIHNNLARWCDAATDGLYDISLENVHINFFTGNAFLRGVHLKPDTAQVHLASAQGVLPQQLVTLLIPDLAMCGINWFALVFRQSFHCASIDLTDAELRITSQTDSLQQTRSSDALTASRFMCSVFTLTNPNVMIITAGGDSLEMHSGGGRLVFENLCYDPDQRKDTAAMSFDIDGFTLDSLVIGKRNSHHALRTGLVSFNSRSRELTIRTLSFKMVTSREEFYRAIGHQKETYDIELPVIRVQGFDRKAFLSTRAIVAEEVEMRDAKVMTMLNRIPRPTPEKKPGRILNQLILRSTLPLDIRQVVMRDAYIKYTEVSDVTRRAGDVVFTAVNGTISNITNIPSKIDSNSVCIATATARSFGLGKLSATFRFPLTSPSGAFEIDAVQEAMDVTKLNAMARNIALAEFRSMDLHRYHIEMKGNESRARGNFTLTYSDLDVTALKINGNEIVNDNVKTLLLNTLMLYPHNPMPRQEVRHVYTEVQRDPYKSFFNHIWTCTMASGLKTTLRNEDAAMETIEKQRHQDAQRRRAAWGPTY